MVYRPRSLLYILYTYSEQTATIDLFVRISMYRYVGIQDDPFFVRHYLYHYFKKLLMFLKINFILQCLKIQFLSGSKIT